MLIMEKLFVFQKAAISATSVEEHSSGTNVDFFAVPTSSIVNISAVQDQVILYFREANTFENSSASFAKVVLNVTSGREAAVVLAVWEKLANFDNNVDFIYFNNNRNPQPINDVLSIESINRFTTEKFPSSGGASLPTGGVIDQVLTKQSATDGDADWEYPHTLYVTVRNVSGGTLPKGTPVHANDVTGEVADVIAADASNSSAMPCTYVLNEEIDNNQQGIAILTGTITGVDTSSFSPGDVVYVAAGGGFTNVKPTGTNLIQNLGVVTKSNASTGSGIIYGTGRSNDVPNLPAGKFFIGSATNTTESAYTLPTSDGSADQILATNGSGAVSFQTISTTDSVVIASTTTQARLNINDNYYTGNDDYGWNYVIWIDPSSFSTSFTDSYAAMGIITPKDITTLDFLSTIERSSGDGTGITVELFTTNRPNGSTSNLTLTSIGSVSVGSTTGVVYNGDIALTGLSISKGTLLFVAIKKTGGTNITTYCRFNYTIIVS